MFQSVGNRRLSQQVETDTTPSNTINVNANTAIFSGFRYNSPAEPMSRFRAP
jgi:hypothetical protein